MSFNNIPMTAKIFFYINILQFLPLTFLRLGHSFPFLSILLNILTLKRNSIFGRLNVLLNKPTEVTIYSSDFICERFSIVVSIQDFDIWRWSHLKLKCKFPFNEKQIYSCFSGKNILPRKCISVDSNLLKYINKIEHLMSS